MQQILQDVNLSLSEARNRPVKANPWHCFVALCAIWHGRMMIFFGMWHIHAQHAKHSKLGPGQSPRGLGLSVQPQRNDGTVWKKKHKDFQEVNPKKKLCVHISWLKDNSMSLCCRIRDWQVFNCSSMNAGRTEVSALADTATQN